MLSIEQIRADANRAGRKARDAGKKPVVLITKNTMKTTEFCKRIPYLGSYVPTGWYLEKSLFVDSSGFGGEGCAMSIEDFIASLEIGKGYAIIEVGEFQVYIGVFVKE